jgi:hypothetical protein
MKQDSIGQMSESQILRYLKHDELDYSSWDRRINSAGNSRVYALSWYLDRTAADWDALIWGDYEYVMPVTLNSKVGIEYLYQPLFCQQLGIFPEPAPEIAGLFYSEIIRRFRFVNILLNSANHLPDIDGIKKFSPRNNFLLNLARDYPAIREGYSKNTLRNIKNAGKSGLNYVRGLSLQEYIEFLGENLPLGVTKNDMSKFLSIVAYCLHKGFGELPGIYTSDNRLCAAVFFCRWKERVIYLNPASNADGRKSSAMFLLLDNFISANAGQSMILDFEGSMVPGVARFYRGFGAEPEFYYPLKINRLPVPLRWIKRFN